MHAENPTPDPAGLPEAWTLDGRHSLAWESLPPKARLAYRLSSLAGFGIPVGAAGLVLGYLFSEHGAWYFALLAAAWLLVLGLAVVHGSIRHRRTRFLLNEDGLRIRRGLCWRSETLVPRTRVQHMDLERGPIERWLGLASLVVHTAGTRMNAVRLAGMDANRGREVRDDLVDRDGGDDDAV
jgi:uncharacterized protein